ncbi:MAG: hypothetical protein WBO46_20075 [Caldilineaceae bacterium]
MTEQTSSTTRKPAATSKRESGRSLLEWQIALLPLMSTLLVGLTLFFFVASFIQLRDLNARITDSPSVQLERTIERVNSPVHQTSSQVLRAAELQILAALDGYALDRRYHQANVLLMSRVWIRYLGFVTGMILALVGASFILGKMRGEESVAQVAAGPVSGAFRGTEPGLVLAVLGVALMMTTIIVHHQIGTEDAPTFMQIWMRRSLGDETLSGMPQVNFGELDFGSTPSPGSAHAPGQSFP